MKTESIIEVIRESQGNKEANALISGVTGFQYAPKPVYYQNKESGQLYNHIAGSIGWPGKGEKGFAVIVAVDRCGVEDSPILRVLDEIEERSIAKLLHVCVKKRKRYGYGLDRDLLPFWWGDYQRFSSLIDSFNQKLGDEDPILLAEPPDFKEANKFEIMFNRIESLLQKDKDGEVRLVLGKNNKLRNHLLNQPHDAASKSDKEFPAIAALGGCVHAVMASNLWRDQAQSTNLVQTIGSEEEILFNALNEHEQFERYLNDFYGEDEDYDDGLGTNTVE